MNIQHIALTATKRVLDDPMLRTRACQAVIREACALIQRKTYLPTYLEVESLTFMLVLHAGRKSFLTLRVIHSDYASAAVIWPEVNAPLINEREISENELIDSLDEATLVIRVENFFHALVEKITTILHPQRGLYATGLAQILPDSHGEVLNESNLKEARNTYHFYNLDFFRHYYIKLDSGLRATHGQALEIELTGTLTPRNIVHHQALVRSKYGQIVITLSSPYLSPTQRTLVEQRRAKDVVDELINPAYLQQILNTLTKESFAALRSAHTSVFSALNTNPRLVRSASIGGRQDDASITTVNNKTYAFRLIHRYQSSGFELRPRTSVCIIHPEAPVLSSYEFEVQDAIRILNTFITFQPETPTIFEL